MAITITPFRPAQADAVARLILSVQRDEFAIPITLEQQPDLRDIPGVYQTGTGGFWVAEDGGAVVGTIALIDIGQGCAALRKMFVAASHRGGTGVAATLLDTVLRHGRAHGLATIVLGTTDAFVAAHRFYEKNGFEPVPVAALPDSFPRMAVDSRFYRLDLRQRQPVEPAAAPVTPPTGPCHLN